MTGPYFDDETVMAFVDGETDAETTARIEEALKTDEELAARGAAFMETRAAAKHALAPLLDEPVPDALMASVRRMVDEHRGLAGVSPAADAKPSSDNVVAFARRAAPAREAFKRQWLAPVAASILVAVLAGGGGYLAGQSAIPQNPDFTRLTPAVSSVLETTASASDAVSVDGGTMKVVSSFRGDGGEFCREFEISPTSGNTTTSVACHTSGNWETRLAISTAPHAAGYVPAGAQETIDTYLSSIGAAGALSAAEEAEALKILRGSQN